MKNYLFFALGICLIDFGAESGYSLITLAGFVILLKPVAAIIELISRFLPALPKNQGQH